MFWNSFSTRIEGNNKFMVLLILTILAAGSFLLKPKRYGLGMHSKTEKRRSYEPHESTMPFVRVKAQYMLSPNYLLASCIVEKNMCSIIHGLKCYLFNSTNFVNNNRSILLKPWDSTSFCANRNEEITTLRFKSRMPYKHKTLFVVRDPIQRFLRAFMEKCVRGTFTCYGCKTDVLCTVEKLYKDIKRLSGEQMFHVRNIGLRELQVSIETKHMAPPTWYCDLRGEGHSFFLLQYGETPVAERIMQDKLFKFLAHNTLEDYKIKYIGTSLNVRTKHRIRFDKRREEIEKTLMASLKRFL